MQQETLFKNNPLIEGKKRLNMAYLLLKNPQIVNTIQYTGGHFFHGTNANALPSILKYGINSVDTSVENNIDVITGEKWSRRNGKRDFLSVTDCLDIAMSYASNIELDEKDATGELLNFGIIFGISLEEMDDINTVKVQSNMPEIGILGNLPIDHIKYILVSEDKVLFVQKMIGNRPIEVLPLNTKDQFLCNNNYYKMLDTLEQDYGEQDKPQYPTYYKDDVIPVVQGRKISKIQETLKIIKDRINDFTNPQNFDKGEER